MQRCHNIDSWVEEKISIFEKDKVDWIRSDQDIKPSDCYVIDRPSLWLKNEMAFYIKIQKNLNQSGIVLIVDICDDEHGIQMCKKADEYKKFLRMLGVVERRSYGNNDLMLFQFWKQEISVGLDEWIDY